MVLQALGAIVKLPDELRGYATGRRFAVEGLENQYKDWHRRRQEQSFKMMSMSLPGSRARGLDKLEEQAFRFLQSDGFSKIIASSSSLQVWHFEDQKYLSLPKLIEQKPAHGDDHDGRLCLRRASNREKRRPEEFEDEFELIDLCVLSAMLTGTRGEGLRQKGLRLIDQERGFIPFTSAELSEHGLNAVTLKNARCSAVEMKQVSP
jgi:hypothetical protein